jgi:hypothetical protein
MADIAEAANPAKKKEPPSKKPPIKSPEKPKKPIGDPPTKTVPKRVTHRFITEHGRAITPLGLLRQSWDWQPLAGRQVARISGKQDVFCLPRLHMPYDILENRKSVDGSHPRSTP